VVQGRCAGASIVPTVVNCSRAGAVDSIEDGDLGAMFDDAGETRVKYRPTEDGVRQESPGIVAGEV
jgi:hypothetical protein